MRKREDEKVLLIAETNWLESIALVQDPVASYLLDLADTKEIEIMFDSGACVERIKG